MRALIDLIIQYKHRFLFVLLEIISLVFLFSFNGHQRSVFFTTANDVVGSAYNVISSITSYIYLQKENQALEAANEELRKEVYTMRQQMEAMQRDSVKHLQALPQKYDLVAAQVVNMTIHKTNNLITINKGEADGIRPEMGVINSQGVVGIVYMTSQHYSIVLPILNEDSKISCRLRKSEFFGSLVWKRGHADIAYVTSVPRHAHVEKNDIVETNGYSDIFPPGLPIGVVQRIGDSPDGMSYFLRAKLFVNFSTLRQVSVITNYCAPERRLLEEMAKDPARLDSVLNQQNPDKATPNEMKETNQGSIVAPTALQPTTNMNQTSTDTIR